MKLIAILCLVCCATFLRAAESTGKSDALIAALKQATTSPNPHVRAAAARALGDLGGDVARQQLIDLLQDKDEVVSAAAAESLAKSGDQVAAPTLIKFLAQTSASTNAAGESPLFKADNPALQHIAEMQFETRSVIAIRALSRMKDPKSGQAIIDHGLLSPQIGVRIAAAIALGRLKEKNAVQPLMEILETYYQAGQSEQGPVIRGGRTEDLQKIKESNAYLRSAVVWALGEIGDPTTKPILKKAADDDNSVVRDTAQEALDKL